MTTAHQGKRAGHAADAKPWSTAISATTETQVFVRGAALDEVIGRESLPAMVLRLWRGEPGTTAETELLGACMVASIDHGALSPSALVARTIASTRAVPMSALAGGILAFGELHGAVVTRAMRIIATAPDGDGVQRWADEVFQAERTAGRRLPGVGHRWHQRDLRAERLIELAEGQSDGHYPAAVRALAASVAAHVGHPVAVNIDGALAVALSILHLDPEYGDFLFAISRGFGLAAHIVEERGRERPMRTIDPTIAHYDGIPIPKSETQEDTP